jgi:predicted RNase H-like HicB family nuclease
VLGARFHLKESRETTNNARLASSLLNLAENYRENPMKKTAKLQKEADGWWAIRSLGEDNILGHGKTREEALVDLERQVTGFLDFLKRSGRDVPGSPR